MASDVDDCSLMKLTSCWQLQREEVLLLRSIYCGEGECLVFQEKDGHLISSGSDTEEDDSLLSEEPREVSIVITFQIQTEKGLGISMTVRFTLPQLYPKFQPPHISLSSNQITQVGISKILQDVESYSRTLQPEPCLMDTLARIRDVVMTLEQNDLVVLADGHHHHQLRSSFIPDSNEGSTDPNRHHQTGNGI